MGYNKLNRSALCLKYLPIPILDKSDILKCQLFQYFVSMLVMCDMNSEFMLYDKNRVFKRDIPVRISKLYERQAVHSNVVTTLVHACVNRA